MTTRMILFGAVSLAGVYVTAAAGEDQAFLPEVRVDNGQLVLTVLSSGCTRKRDFSFTFGPDMSFTVTRLRPDRCRAAPRPESFRFDFAELGLSNETRYY